MKTRNKLEKAQKSALLGWVAEGLETSEINKRAAAFEPPFRVSPAQVDYYRKTRKVNLQEIAQSGEYDALKTGLALKEERVKRLTLLAALMEEDLFNGVLWTSDVKMIGTGEFQERVEFEEFNASEVQQYRGVLDDIAKEVSGRVQRQEAMTLDLTQCSDAQLERIAKGEDVYRVLADTRPS
jgi:hypothetical protein